MKHRFRFPSFSPQLSILYLLHLFNDGSQAVLGIILPFIVANFHINLAAAGLLGSIMNSATILLALPAGYIAKRIGGLKTLLIALLTYGLGYLAIGFAPSYALLICGFMIAGVGFGVFHPIAFALVAKLSDKKTRGKHMGDFTATGDVGKIGIVAGITFIIVSLGWQTTTLFAGGILLLIAIFFLLFFFKIKEHFTTKQTLKTQPISLITILSHKPFICVAIANVCDAFASGSLFIFLPFLLLKRGIEPALLGAFTAVFFIGTLSGKAVLGRLADKFGAVKVFILSELLMASFIFLLANATQTLIIIVCSVILGIFTKGTTPVLQTLIAETGEHHGNFEKIFSITIFLASIAMTAAPMMLGALSDTYGIVMAFNLIAAVALVGIIPILFFKRVR